MEPNTILFHHAALGIITNSEGQILITQRPLHKLKGGFWEFPGGKIEVNEKPENALIRELKEEIDIEVTHFQKLMQYKHEYEKDSYEVLLEVFLINKYIGEAKGFEGQNIAWVAKNELLNYPLLPPNIKILEYL